MKNNNICYFLLIIVSVSLMFLMSFAFSAFSNEAIAQKKKRQTIDLEGLDVDGEVRTPEGNYILQKSDKDFLPLYEKRREMNEEIKKMVHFLR